MPSETLLSEFRASLSFPLDAYQLDACRVLDSERSVLVAAPTGAGKTLVGEYAITRALAAGEKAFYTAPIKALSNQKYHDLVALHGAEAVGLLTGDTSVNGEAPVVVMTTEVLRNMLYSGSDTLNGLRYVVMDEVHYLADRFRGSVWEEVIIHLDPDVLVVALSATVSNAEEFGDWLAMVRGDCGVIVSEHRPVPLYQHVAVSQGKYDLPALLSLKEAQRLPKEQRQAQTRQRGSRQGQSRRYQSRQDYAREDQSSQRSHRHDDHDQRAPHQRSGSHHRPAPLRRPPRRSAVVEALEQEHLLPAIFFIFSRVGCDKAVSQCLRAGLTLTTPQEEAEIRFLVENRAAEIPPEDLDVLEYWQWSAALARGIASHHAGLLPVFKQTVEELFVRGLIKVVFATETLALGINMPARSVVLEKLVKFNGISHEPLTAGEYTQLTGRAGRRGIDVEGHAVVVDQPALNVGALANLSTRRTYPLNSAFTPSYNMAVNLIAHAGDARAREILEMSFAQFQTDRSVVGLAKKAQSMPDNRARKKLIKRITSMTGTITRTYDMNCGVLEELGYLRRSHGELTVTEQGQWLRTIYTE
ncbi:MAG: DEAD/DEAH box helicase, partial [Cellulomonadaceae bacterium]|nr:DEAD/DEAH box helicase [Cellulomonadaceae bacterium]